MQYISKILAFSLGLSILGLLFPSCDKERPHTQLQGGDMGDTYIQLSIPNPRGADPALPTNEDKIHQLRLIITAPDGHITINRLVSVVNGPNDVTNGWASVTEALNIAPGTYNLYVVANEASAPGLTEAITAISNEAALLTDPALKALAFDKTFVPTNQKGMVMTGKREAITITAGHPQTSPQRVAIDLIRTCAKLSFSITRTATAETKKLTVRSVEIADMPSAYSLFPQTDPLFGFAGSLSENYQWDFSADPLAALGQVKMSYMPEFILKSPTEKRKMIVTVQREGTTDVMTHEIILHEKSTTLTPDKKYNFDRNQHYNINIKIRDWTDIAVEFNVLDWAPTNIDYVYVGEYFNLRYGYTSTQGPGRKITIQTSKPTNELPSRHEVLVKRIDGVSTFDNGATEQIFSNRQYGAYEVFYCSPISGGVDGYHFEVFYNGQSMVKL